MFTGLAITCAAVLAIARLGSAWFLVAAGLGLLLTGVAGVPHFERERAKYGRAYTVEVFAIWLFAGGMVIAMWVADNPSLGYIGMAGLLVLGFGLKKRRERR